MATLTNPLEIARETLRQLALRRTPPTPDNYKTLYHEISGTKAGADSFPEKQLRSLAAALPKSSPDQLRLARELDNAVKNENWDSYRDHLSAYVTGLAENQKLAWSELIADLLRQWEAKQSGATPAMKREALDHVLNSGATNPETLFNRLQSLTRSWSQNKEAGLVIDENLSPHPGPPDAGKHKAVLPPPAPDRTEIILSELRELFAFTLETAVATQLIESPALAADAKVLALDIRKAASVAELQEFLTKLKRFAFKLELLSEDQAELRHSLLSLLRLLVENMTELVLDDRWLHGQIEVVRDIIEKPLSQRALDDAERRLREVLFKQSQLKQSLQEAREALKSMLAGFVDHLADFADTTSDYHDKIEACAARISAANDITDLENVLGEVMREMRGIQANAQRSRDELRASQQRAKEAEAKISSLEKELEETSHLVRHDQLTGAMNRRGLEEVFNKEAARAQRHETVICVGLLDIDNFKKLNDSMGHDTGDKALIHLAATCRQTLRPQDALARFGGEEFVILLPETSLDDAQKALTRLQRELTKNFFLHDNEKVLITFSAGVTQWIPGESLQVVVKRADEAMYQAKQTGKNRVIAA